MKLLDKHSSICFPIGLNVGFACPDGSAVPSLYNVVEEAPNTYYHVHNIADTLYADALTTCGGRIFMARTQDDWTDVMKLATGHTKRNISSFACRFLHVFFATVFDQKERDCFLFVQRG